MKKTVEFDPYSNIQTRREAIHGYVERFTARDTIYAQHIAGAISKPDQPLADYVVLIPVAAHQEAEQIEPALAQYAHQQHHTPFSVVLGLNSPISEEGNPQISATIAAIEKAKQHHPYLDIRDSMTYYETPIIGEIRRDLWNGTLLSAMDSGTYLYEDDEMIGINHDIDLVSMSPRYMERVQRYYAGRRRAYANAGMAPVPFSPRATLLKHAPSSAHPNITKGAYWMDFMTRQLNGPYEASLVIPFSHYADRDGFQAEALTHETGSLFDYRMGASPYIPGTTMQTSPRRYVDRLRYGYDKIWTNDTFGPSDICRTSPAVTDISQLELESIIGRRDTVRHTVAAISSAAIQQFLRSSKSLDEIYDAPNEMTLQLNSIITKKIKLTYNILTRIIHSESLSAEAAMLNRDLEYRKTLINDHFVTER
jgi:hypothetical protein